MKKETTYVDVAEFEKLVAHHGAEVLALKGWMKVSFGKTHRVYLPRTKTVGRCDLAGFVTAGIPGVLDLGESSFGSVKQQLDFSLPEDEILLAFDAVLEHMKALPAEEVMSRKKSDRKESTAVGWSSSHPTKESRKELIERVAREKGVEVSADAGI